MAGEGVRPVGAGDWQAEVLEAQVPVLVDFWATWCVPCKTLLPTLETAAQEHGKRIRVLKLNVEEHIEVATRYHVSTMPTLLLFKGGQVVEQRVGLVSRQKLAELIQPHLA